MPCFAESERRELVSHGVEFDVYKTIFTLTNRSDVVAMKTFRRAIDVSVRRRRAPVLNHAIEQWCALQHPNIHPVYGIYELSSPDMSILTPFCQDGNVLEYLASHRSANKSKLVLELALGLAYIHSRNMAHGNIKPENVLIYKGKACITDIGVSSLLQLAHFQEGGYLSPPQGWMYKPLEELWAADTGGNLAATPARDMFAFAHVVYHMYMGRPFWHPKRLNKRLLAPPEVENMSQVPGPHEIPVQVWSVLQRCWAQNITMDKVVGKLQEI
ncbi:kinase-like protein [Neolentinus lepideus HHB14362 ss-1]|uniref:Kinase-like protein n=1 Tax=Neolentinus lepideus HHB14362 ss-1 TaxID=1314782 RepID=A0A165P7Q5_9AGAM|nr:kinase-like protein [Neolentinus lepideus HHB14362 ss-1]